MQNLEGMCNPFWEVYSVKVKAILRKSEAKFREH